MNNRNFFVIGWILIALFLFGLLQLMMLRFSAGDVYPYYSTLRADPLGAKALYESLEICCGFHVERNHEPFSKIKSRFDSTTFVLGMPHTSMAAVPKNIAEEIDYYISSGGRLIISLYKQPKDQQILSLNTEGYMDLMDVWDLRVFDDKRTQGVAHLVNRNEESLPETISTYSSLYFQTIHSSWRAVYQRSGHPVVIERKLGRGSLVLTAESYLFSNEAMAKERYPSLLLWFSGKSPSIIFDEYHHGIAAGSGVIDLARKYGLEWFLLMFFLLALLFIWKNASPLVPPVRESAEAMQSGKESIAGLTNLLRRNVPATQLLPVCFSEWQRIAKNVSEPNRNAMQTIVNKETAKPARQRDLPAAYNAMSRALKQRR